MLRDLAQTQSWADHDLFSVDTLVDCGPTQIDFFNDDQGKSELDPSLFAVDPTAGF